MIIRRDWRTLVYKGNISKYIYEGWFLFGIIPLYINRVTVYNK